MRLATLLLCLAATLGAQPRNIQLTKEVIGGLQYTAVPTFFPTAGEVANPTTVTISSSACDSYVYWKTSAGVTTGDTHSNTFSVTGAGTWYAKVIGCPGHSDSAEVSAAYTIPVVSYLYQETFEGSAACSGNNTCDTVPFYIQGTNTNYTTSPAPLQGARSAAGTAGSSFLQQTFTANDEVYVAWIMEFTGLAVNDLLDMQTVNAARSLAACHLKLYSNNQIFVDNTGGTRQYGAAFSISANTKYYFMLRSKKGTGANAECQGYWSTNGSIWSATPVSNDGTWTFQLGSLSWFDWINNTSFINIWDDIRVSTSSVVY